MTDPIIPPGPSGAGPIDATSADDETKLPVNNDDLDEGETADDRETVDQDIAEAAAANERLNEDDQLAEGSLDDSPVTARTDNDARE